MAQTSEAQGAQQGGPCHRIKVFREETGEASACKRRAAPQESYRLELHPAEDEEGLPWGSTAGS